MYKLTVNQKYETNKLMMMMMMMMMLDGQLACAASERLPTCLQRRSQCQPHHRRRQRVRRAFHGCRRPCDGICPSSPGSGTTETASRLAPPPTPPPLPPSNRRHLRRPRSEATQCSGVFSRILNFECI